MEQAGPAARPFVSSNAVNRFLPLLFATRGITPVGYAAFAFALSVALGVVIRHTLAAMAATLAVFAFVQIAFLQWVRPHLMAPVRSSTPLLTSAIHGLGITPGGKMSIFASASKPGAWVLSNQVTTPSGQVFTGPAPAQCGRNNGFQACQNAVGGLHLRELVLYQPAGRYWAFQWYETGIFLVLALLLAGLCFWWTRRRLS